MSSGTPEPLGRNWLLLRGLGREAGHWGGFVQQLQNAFPHAQVNTLDLPGSGRYHQETSPTRLPDIVALCRQRALDLGYLQTPTTFLALSLGGMTVWQWLHDYPQDGCGAVLINSSFAGLSPFYRRLCWQNYFRLFDIAATHSAFEQESAILRLVSNQAEPQRRATAQAWAQLRLNRALNPATVGRQLLAAARFRPQTKPHCPVLLLNSQGDRLVAPQCSQDIAQRYGLPLLSHPQAGHDLPLDDGAWLVAQLQNWCGSAISPPRCSAIARSHPIISDNPANSRRHS
jgi:pimeloyl-[acyl-carrier protein] methyl ester esterase